MLGPVLEVQTRWINLRVSGQKGHEGLSFTGVSLLHLEIGFRPDSKSKGLH